MICVTSFSQKGYELYGKRFLETFVENWPCEVIVYYEELPDFQHEKVIYKPLMEVFGIQAFLKYCDSNPIFKGITPSGYNYNFDAAKFCLKVFAQFDALKNNSGKVIWLDADTFTKKKITKEWIDELFEGAGLVYLGREGFHCESGFVGFDTKAEGFSDFLEKYIECYRKGKIFNLKRWHDCGALDWVRSFNLVKEKNLSDFWKIPKDKIMTLEELDVFGRSVLGEYMTHLKGNRKSENKLH